MPLPRGTRRRGDSPPASATPPRWSPDGKRLAFVRSIEKDGKTQPAQIYLFHMDGGEARRSPI